MVARTPLKQSKKIMVAPPLSPTLLRETVKKVDQCMARLQELQYVTAGNKVVNGVKLSPRSTRSYLKTSLRCKQESIRTKNNASKKSPTGKLPAGVTGGEWRRMSITAMLVGETVAEILEASKVAKEIMGNYSIDDPKTPLPRKQKPNSEKTPIETRRKREKQHQFRIVRPEPSTPAARRARSKINFKVSPEKRPTIDVGNNNGGSSSKRYMTNKVSPKHKPWAKKAVLFPNPLFHSSPTSKQQQFCKTKSPLIGAKKRETPHKFLVKSPVKIKTPPKGITSVSPVLKPTPLRRKSKSPPPIPSSSMASKLRRSLSPSRLANRFVSPLKGRRMSMNVTSSSVDGLMMNSVKQKPALMMMPMRFNAPREVGKVN